MPAAEAVGSGPRPRAVVPQRQIRDALAAGDLDLHYQPIVDLQSGRIASYEALLRLRSATGGLLSPDDFLPAIVHTPVMHEVTSWVLDRACADLGKLVEAGGEKAAVSVNLAASDLLRPTLVDAVRDTLERYAIEPTRLTIELTEHAAVQAVDKAAEVLGRLRALGVELSLDDFGTGYSSLLYLRDLPLTQVKIDRTFVEGIGANDDDNAIVRSVIALAHRVGLAVVAEGVEHREQLKFLRAAQCDLVQGYLLAPPAAADDVTAVIDPVLVGSSSQRVRRRSPTTPAMPEQVRGQMGELAARGASLHTIAAALNRDGHETPAGTRWTAATVARALTDSP